MGAFRIDRLSTGPRPLTGRGGRILAARCAVARTGRARLVGLLGTPDLAADEALWLTRCASVHTMFLRARIGCAFLDRAGVVLRVVDPLPRWRAAGCRGAAAAVECAAGVLAAAGVQVGDRLELGARTSLGANESARLEGVIRRPLAPPVITAAPPRAPHEAGGAR